MIRSRILVTVSAVLAIVSCGGADQPAPPTASTAASTSGVVPLDPEQRLRELSTTYGVNSLRSCSPEHLDQARCAKELIGAGRAVEKFKEAVIADETTTAEQSHKIVAVADDVLGAVNVMKKGGCYGMGPPSAAADSLSLCDTLAMIATLTWMELVSVASGQ
ncbi:hypothetical protein [Saccharothrix stipae]